MMNKLLMAGAVIVAVGLGVGVASAKPDRGEGKTRGERPERAAGEGRQQDKDGARKAALEKYDKNKDGKLDEEERAAARAERGGSKGGDDARKAALEKYDKNKDGKLDEEERAAARADRGGDRPERARGEKPAKQRE
jgi:hypothetical protein